MTFARLCALALALAMRMSIVLACVSLSMTTVQAAGGDALGYDDARHLLGRTGFAPAEADVRAYAGLPRAEAVRRLLAGGRAEAITPLPGAIVDAAAQAPRGPNLTAEERKAFVREQVQEGVALRAWWIQEMLVTPSPLTERMTLFWHNHFVSAQPKVRLTRLMARQNATLRANALGNFATLLHAMARDPAMIVYLDGAQNRRGAPNENFAREVMELFTLGEGHYTEQDVKEAARAFTGWSVDRETERFIMRPRLHDTGPKTIFGSTGNFDGDDVLDLLLKRPETAEFVVTKLWREFVGPQVDAREISRIAARFRDSQYDIRTALGEILQAPAFYAAENRGALIKSPVELVVGTLRQLDLRPREARPFALAVAGMSQNLFSPPNVKGWPGGEAWINTSTLLARKQFIERLTRGDDNTGAMSGPAMSAEAPSNQASLAARQVLSPNGTTTDKPRAQRIAAEIQRGTGSLQLDSARWMATSFGGDTESSRNAAAARLLLTTSPQQPLDVHADSLTFLRSVLLDAAYQLK
ncbi:MAG: DUF1800 domain-containing protein [Pseudomonadota bacterium]|nr:DUF1800 domain-containing protein [Pseudomonadota bacterium]